MIVVFIKTNRLKFIAFEGYLLPDPLESWEQLLKFHCQDLVHKDELQLYQEKLLLEGVISNLKQNKELYDNLSIYEWTLMRIGLIDDLMREESS